MKRLNNKGFGVIEGLIILIVVGVIGLVGWRVVNSNKNEDQQQPQSTTTAQSAKPDSEIKSGPGNEWNTYINHKLGFSIHIPKKFAASNGGPCTKTDYVYDNYGEKVSAPTSYVPEIGVIPATVVEDSNDFYVASEYTYQRTGLHDYGDGYQLADGCKKIQTTAAVVTESHKTNSSYSLDLLPFSVINVKDQADITKWVQKKFSKDVFVTGLKTNPAGWEDVGLDCKNTDDFCLNFVFRLHYYKAQHKLVYLELGQAGEIAKPDNKSFYDENIFDSFKLN